MQEILDLKQQLLLGNFDNSLEYVTQIETIAYQNQINAITNSLILIVSRLMLLQINNRIDRDSIRRIRNLLINIQQRNKLGDGFYIEGDKEWQKLLVRSFPIALLIAVEDKETQVKMNVEQLKQSVDCQLLQAESLSLVHLIYSLDAYEIGRW